MFDEFLEMATSPPLALIFTFITILLAYGIIYLAVAVIGKRRVYKESIRSVMNTKWDDYAIQILIVLSLVLLVVETEPWLSPAQLYWLHMIDKSIVIIFTIEYMIRLWLDGRKFALSFHGVIDLLAILPYYISLGAGFQSIRVFRLFRLLRLLKLARYTSALDKIARALHEVRNELIIFGFITVAFIYLAAVLMFHFEHDVQPDKFPTMLSSMWWSVVTFTTIGYGDVSPVTGAGQLVTGFLSLVGLGVVAIPTGLISASLSKINQKDDPEIFFRASKLVLVRVPSDGSCDACYYNGDDECPREQCGAAKFNFVPINDMEA